MLHEQSAVLSVDGSYFVDANKDIFAHVLNYLRDGKLPPSDVALCVYKCASRLEIQSLRDELESHPSVMAQNILSMYDNISIFHGCMVRIEKSVTRVTDRHHEACRVMPNSDPE